MPKELAKMKEQFERLEARVVALEIIAGVERPAKEKVRPDGHDYSQDQE